MGSGGKERRLTELLKNLVFHDITYELVVMSDDIHYKEVFNLGIKIHQLVRKTKKDIFIIRKIFRLCRDFKPDIVHCWDSMTAVYLVLPCKLLNIKLINGMVVDTPVNQSIGNKSWLRARLTFPFSDTIVGNSMAGLKAYRANGRKSQCIYNGIDFERFTQLKGKSLVKKELKINVPDSRFIVGMVATFGRNKDYRTLIKAALSIVNDRDDISFILVGDGPDLETIKGIVPVQLSEKIFFTGKRSDVESIIKIFDVGVLLTNSKVHGEGISNSILEYMSLGKAVIATRGGGTDEVVIDFKNGFLIDPGNEGQLIEKILCLIGNRKLAIEFGDYGRRMIKEKFNIGIMVNKYISLYNKLKKG